jgi:hypothetical protein
MMVHNKEDPRVAGRRSDRVPGSRPASLFSRLRRNGSTISCPAGGGFGNGTIDGGQGEAVRVPQAGGTLVPVPGSGHPDAVLKSLLAAERIIALSRNPERQKVAREFGATDIIEARGDEADLMTGRSTQPRRRREVACP